MIRLVALAGMVFFLFCASVGLSLYLQGFQNQAPSKSARAEKEVDPNGKAGRDSQGTKIPGAEKDHFPRDPVLAKGPDQNGLTSIFGEGKKTGLPGAPSAGGALAQADTQRGLRDRQMEWIQLDLRGEQMILERLQKQLEEENKVLLERLERYEKWQKRKDQEEKKAAPPILNPNGNRSVSESDQQPEVAGSAGNPRSSQESDRDEAVRLRQVASIYESMAPDHAAKILTQMADSGNLDMAAQIISLVKDRQAARILAEMHDPALGAQLLEKIKGFRQQAVPEEGPRVRDRFDKRTGR